MESLMERAFARTILGDLKASHHQGLQPCNDKLRSSAVLAADLELFSPAVACADSAWRLSFRRSRIGSLARVAILFLQRQEDRDKARVAGSSGHAEREACTGGVYPRPAGSSPPAG